MKVIHLQTSKVIGNGNDGYSKIERKTVKLEDGKVFDDFIKRFILNGYSIKGEDYPKVVKVINTFAKVTKEKDNLDQITDSVEIKREELKEIEAYQKIVDEALKPVTVDKVESNDVKALKDENEALKKRLDAIDAMLINKEKIDDIILDGNKDVIPEQGDKEKLLEEAKDLGAKVDGRMSIETIQSKIDEIKNA